MDVLSSQAAIAGYAAVLEGARVLDVLLPMLTTAAGSIEAAKMIALGGGRGRAASHRHGTPSGAITHGFDVREAAREQVEALLPVRLPDVEPAPRKRAAAMPPSSRRPADATSAGATEHLAPTQLIVTSARIPGKPAPR